MLTNVAYIDDRMQDIQSIIANVSRTYCDKTCYALQQEDLEAECFAKLARIISEDKWVPFVDKPRSEFFAYIKTVFNNHVKSHVVKHRLTAKRGYDTVNHQKCVDLNIADYTETITPRDPTNVDASRGTAMRTIDDALIAPAANQQWLNDLAPVLTPLESLVLRQILMPNNEAWLYQYAMSFKKSKRVVITKEALANGLGIYDVTVTCQDGTARVISAVEFYELVEHRLKLKLEKYMKQADDPTQTEYYTAVRSLETIFELQIPGCIENVVVRRIFSLAARDQYEKVNADVMVLLRKVGAIVPECNADGTLRCFGVLYRSSAQACKICSLRSSCGTAAINVGLGVITLSQKVLEQGAQRSPVMYVDMETTGDTMPLDTDDTPVTASTTSVSDGMALSSSSPTPRATVPARTTDVDMATRNAQIIQFLDATLKRSKSKVDLYYQLNVNNASDKRKQPYVFIIKNSDAHIASEVALPMRFCKPSDGLIPVLHPRKTGYYLPDKELELCLALIKQHINEFSSRDVAENLEASC